MSPVLRLAVAWTTLFVLGTDLFVVSPLLPLIAGDYRVSVAAAGSMVTLFALAYMTTAPLTGNLADRVGRRRMVVAGLLVFALANALTAAAPGFPGLLAARLLAGISAAAVTPSIYAIVGGTAPPGKRATWLSIVVSGLLVSLMTGAPAGLLFGTAYGWPSVFAGLAVLSLMAVPLNRAAWPADHPGTARAEGGLGGGALAGRLLATVVWATALYGVYTYLGAGLVAQGADADAIARIFFLYGLGALVGTLLGGRMADRLGSRLTAATSCLGLAAAFFALRATFATGHAPGLGAALGFGVASVLAQLFFPAQQAALAADFPARSAAALAWNNSALFFGILLGALAGGEIFTLVGFANLLAAAAALAVAGAGVVGAALPRRAAGRG